MNVGKDGVYCRGPYRAFVNGAGKLGPKGASARVIYGQTDSVFVHLPDCSPAEAVHVGQLAGRLVSEAFPPEMKLAFEKVRAQA